MCKFMKNHNGYYGATKLLLENGADPNYQESDMNKNGLLALRFYNNDKAAETLQLLLDYGTDLDIRTNVGYGIDESGREMLKNFENDYGKVKENVPDYDDIVSIINNLEKRYLYDRYSNIWSIRNINNYCNFN